MLIVASLAAPREAHAGDVERARQTFAEGVRLYKAGDYEGARRLFREADAEHHAPAIVYNVGLAEEKLGHAQAAVDAYESYISEAGDQGELSPAAAAAIAQIKSRSTRLRIETKPSGARVFVDGSPLAEVTPTQVLVPAGHHIVVAQKDGWRGELDVEAKGVGDVMPVSLEEPQPAEATVTAPESALPTPTMIAPRGGPLSQDMKPPQVSRPDGLVWGAEFAVMPAYMLGVDNPTAPNARDGVSIAAGPLLEGGFAITEHFEFLARGFIGIGPDAKPSYAYMGGPGLSIHALPSLWVGASFIGGRFDTRAHDTRYDTDIVFGTMLEANWIVLKRPMGEWLVGFQPALLMTERRRDNTTIFFPFSFGFRAY